MLSKVVTFILLLFSLCQTKGQYTSYPFEAKRYDFIRYDKNKFIICNDSIHYLQLFELFGNIVFEGKGQLKILHIGGSHVQADIYSNRIRQRLAGFCYGSNGGRGFVFPYSIAKTNNPWNYSVHYSGQWQSCRNVEKDKDCEMGLSGITVWTYDTAATISIKTKNHKNVRYDFNKLTVFHDNTPSELKLLYPAECQLIKSDTMAGFTSFVFNNYYDSLQIGFSRINPNRKRFNLYGLEIQNDNPGIIYDAIGVNGASLKSFMKCSLFEQQLKIVDPNWVIISIGTNDAYTSDFHSELYKARYETFIGLIKRALPEAAIMLTVPNDSYLHQIKPNENTRKVQAVIYELAEKYRLGVWDLYDIMGGFDSSSKWYDYGLMKYDLVHFSVPGYILKGDLFFNAFLIAFDEYMNDIYNNKHVSE